MSWHCVHCGCQIDSIGSDTCPNCEKDPFHTEDGELLQIRPADFRKFISTGKLNKRTKRIKSENHQRY